MPASLRLICCFAGRLGRAPASPDYTPPRSINLELTLLRSIFKFAIQQRAAVHNPAKEISNLKEIRDEHWIPTEDELIRFVKEAEGTRSAVVLVPWIWFRAYTGTRPTESVHVEWRDIDFVNERISIRPKDGHALKNRKFRVVEMHPRLKEILLAWRIEWGRIFAKRRKRHPGEASPPHDWVFFNPSNQDERARGFHKCFYKARDNAGLPEMTSHTLRHYFISRCVMDGIDYLTIMRWVGHSFSRMIESVYGHLHSGHRASQMRKLQIVEEHRPAEEAQADQ